MAACNDWSTSRMSKKLRRAMLNAFLCGATVREKARSCYMPIVDSCLKVYYNNRANSFQGKPSNKPYNRNKAYYNVTY
jgi:hypothetical protein